MTEKVQKPIYMSPEAKTIDIEAQAIICQSGGINGMNLDSNEYGNYFE